MQPTNLTSINFDDIKSSIKSYLRTRTEFTDYDFDGSALSYLIDILAYNTYYSAFTANMLINESFIHSATMRSNIAAIAKMLNYVPKSRTSAKVCIKLTIPKATLCPDTTYPLSVTLDRGPVLAAKSFVFNTLTERTVQVDSLGVAVFDKMLLYEGTLVDFEYTVDTFRRQRFVIPNSDVDIDTLQVFVKPNAQSTSIDSYIESTNITDVDSTSRIYHINEGPDLRYEIFFGDGTIGRKLKDGEIIILRYAVSSGEAANDVLNATYVGRLVDSCGHEYDADEIDIEILGKSQEGSERESVESIKYNAPRFFAAQNRAVTTTDYETLVRKVYPNTTAAVAYGGENLKPAVYGKVFISLATVSGQKLNDTIKDEISKGMQKYTVGALEVVVKDPIYLYIIARIFVTFDQNKTSLTNAQIQNKAIEAAEQFAKQSNLNNFSGIFSTTKLIKAVSLADPSIDGVSTQTLLLKYIETNPNIVDSHQVLFGTELLDSAPSQKNVACDKEGVIQGGPLYVDSDPDKPLFFTDDGKGKIYLYYDDGGNKVVVEPNFGTVNYKTGEVNVGPVNIVGDGNNVPQLLDPDADTEGLTTIPGPGADGGGVGDGGGGGEGAGGDDTGTGGGGGGGSNNFGIGSNPLSIPVVAIPANSSTILPTTPGTIMAFPTVDITVAPITATPPPTIPLNNINPGQFITPPPVVIIPPKTADFITPGVDIKGCF